MDVENRVILNVGGTRFETYKAVLKKIPATRLSRLTEALVNYDPVTNEYFFDRHPGVFSQILNYYRTGKLHYPTNVCGPLFEEELAFWGLDMNQVEPCCWKTYTKHRSTEETLATLDRLNIDVERTSKEDLALKFDLEESANSRFACIKRIQPVLWQLFEEPRSSKVATVIAGLQILMIIVSVAVLWLSSYSSSRYQVYELNNEINSYNPGTQTSMSLRMIDDKILNYVLYIDYATIAWFSFDLTLRFIVSPNKLLFIKKFDNYIDFIATVWFYIDVLLSSYFVHPILRLFEVLRVLRLLRLFSYNPGLKVIITSLKASASVLQLLLVIMLIASTLYGSFVFYAEKLTTDDPDDNKFLSIPDGLWYAVVSLTTIGYGDLSPQTTLGRVFGTFCVITGVLMIGLPMTIIVEIFTNFYNHLRARSKMPKQRRRILPVEAPRLRKKIGHGMNNIDTSAINPKIVI